MDNLTIQDVYDCLRDTYNSEPRAWMCDFIRMVILEEFAINETKRPISQKYTEDINTIVAHYDNLFGKCDGVPIPMGPMTVIEVLGKIFSGGLVPIATLVLGALNEVQNNVNSDGPANVFGPALPTVEAMAAHAIPDQADIQAFYENALLAGAAGAAAFTGDNDGVASEISEDLYPSEFSEDEDTIDYTSDDDRTIEGLLNALTIGGDLSDEDWNTEGFVKDLTKEDLADDDCVSQVIAIHEDFSSSEYSTNEYFTNQDLLDMVGDVAVTNKVMRYELTNSKKTFNLRFAVYKGEVIFRSGEHCKVIGNAMKTKN